MEKVRFAGRDGLSLSGDLHRLAGKSANCPGLIICHGFRGNKAGGGRAVGLAEKATQLGIAVLRFDFSGTGESAGNFADATLSNYILDLTGAVDFVISVTGGKVIVLGRSFGGTTAICQAAGDHRVAAVCSWSAPVELAETFIEPFRSLLENGEELLKLADENGSYWLRRQFFTDLQKHNVLRAAAGISPRPFLIVHGTADETVSFAQAVRLAEAARQPKNKLFVEKGDHRFLAHYDLVEVETLNWLRRLTGNWRNGNGNYFWTP